MKHPIIRTVQMYTLRDYMKTPEALASTLDRVAAMGYDGVQTQIPGFLTPAAYAALLRERGLFADSLSASLVDIVKDPAAAAAKAAVLGTDVVRVNGMPRPDGKPLDTTKEGFLRFAEILQKAADLLEAEGFRMMYHNHHGEYTMFCDALTGENVCGMKLVVENTAKNVLFQPDIHHIHYAGFDIADTLGWFDGRAHYIHMQGYGFRPGDDKPCTMPVGLGTYNWEKIVAAALKIGVYNFVAEQDYVLGDPFDDLAFSAKSLDRLLKR